MSKKTGFTLAGAAVVAVGALSLQTLQSDPLRQVAAASSRSEASEVSEASGAHPTAAHEPDTARQNGRSGRTRLANSKEHAEGGSLQAAQRQLDPQSGAESGAPSALPHTKAWTSSASNGGSPPVPSSMLASREAAPFVPAVPTPYGPLKLSPELAAQYLEERQEKYAATLDSALSEQARDPVYERDIQTQVANGMAALKMSGASLAETQCGASLCRFTFTFGNELEQKRLEPVLRNMGLAIKAESWLKRLSDSGTFQSAVYVGRGTRLPTEE